VSDVVSKVTKKNGQKRPRAIAAERFSFTLSSNNGRALSTQIREHVRDLIERGVLVPGMRLPPVRALAEQLAVNQVTVAKAYRELAESNLIKGRRGGGSFVRAPVNQPALDDPTDFTARPLLAERLFELARAPGVIAFTSNYPAIDDINVAEFRECIRISATDKLDSCFHYDPPLGRPELRRQIQTYLKAQGIETDADNVVVTSGGQQAIDLSVRALVPPGAPVIVEKPAYYGAINALRGVRARILEVPVEDDGMNLDILKSYLIRDRARFIYTNPTFQNPTGSTMGEAKRRTLLALAGEFNAVILEDDHSSEIRFSGQSVPAIRALADENDPVLYARGFGKVFLPGTRLGYLVVPDSLRRKILMAKAYNDLHSNSFMQEAVACYLARRSYQKLLERQREKYGRCQRLLYDGLVAGMPAGATVNHPEGGLSLWLTLPEGADVSELYFRAVRRGVAFVSGEVFYASSSKSRSLRISFGLNQPQELEEGVERLCSVVKDLLNRRDARTPTMM
jgi:DNA-binding transcriptional MocR family regulator